MKVLFVYPKTYYRRALPLGIAYIAAVLRENGHTVKVYDPAPYEKVSFRGFLRKFDPEVVGFSSTTLQMLNTLEMLRVVKDVNPNIYTILGGVHPTSDPGTTLANKNVDFVVFGEGEETTRELIDFLEKGKDISSVKGIGYKKEGQKFTERRPYIEDIDSLPFPARDLFPMKWYSQATTTIRGSWLRTTNIMTSRGCPYNCIYCASKVMWNRNFRMNSAERVVDEMEFIINKYKLEALILVDDTFYINKKRILNICSEIKKRKLDFVWAAQSRIDNDDEEIIKAISGAGCIQLAFGVESGSNKVLKGMNKLTSAEKAVPAFRLCQKYGLRTLANFMIGNPEETMEDIEKSRRLAHALKADFVDFYITTPFPGTELLELAKKNGWIKEDFDKNLNSFKLDEESPMEINFTSKQLVALRNKLRKEFISEKLSHYIKNPKFIKDALLIALTNPSLAPKIISKYIKTRDLEASLREFENVQRARRFP